MVFALIGLLETTADHPALSILPSLVGSRDLDRANSRISATQLVADEFIGPPFGGLMFAAAMALPLAATDGAYAAAALLFLGLAGSFRSVRRPGRRTAPHRDVLEGATWLARHPLLRSLAVIGGLSSVAYMMPFSILVLFARDVLGLGSAGYGILLSVSALGGLAGAASLLAIFLADVPWVAGLFLATYILHAVVFSVCVGSLRQRLVPDRLRGRVNAVSKLFGLAGLAIGAGLGGLLATVFDLAVPFLAGSLVFVGCAAIAWPNLRAWEASAAVHS